MNDKAAHNKDKKELCIVQPYGTEKVRHGPSQGEPKIAIRADLKALRTEKTAAIVLDSCRIEIACTAPSLQDVVIFRCDAVFCMTILTHHEIFCSPLYRRTKGIETEQVSNWAYIIAESSLFKD
jgi:hypothetical protein